VQDWAKEIATSAKETKRFLATIITGLFGKAENFSRRAKILKCSDLVKRHSVGHSAGGTWGERLIFRIDQIGCVKHLYH